MNAFEQIVSKLFQANGYWTMLNFHVDLTKEDKKKIGKPSMPKPELDVLAYKSQTNTLVWVECKSYLDSGGVCYASFINPDDPGYERFKVFNYGTYREIIALAIIRQSLQMGLARENPEFELCLVAGKVKSDQDRQKIGAYFKSKDWLFYDRNWILDGLKKAAVSSYEDDAMMLVAKMLLK